MSKSNSNVKPRTKSKFVNLGDFINFRNLQGSKRGKSKTMNLGDIINFRSETSQVSESDKVSCK
jgi:hypothetical protein